jgi:hypothetical protein
MRSKSSLTSGALSIRDIAQRASFLAAGGRSFLPWARCCMYERISLQGMAFPLETIPV